MSPRPSGTIFDFFNGLLGPKGLTVGASGVINPDGLLAFPRPSMRFCFLRLRTAIVKPITHEIAFSVQFSDNLSQNYGADEAMARKRISTEDAAEDQVGEGAVRPGTGAPQVYKPTARECALLLLHLISTKKEESGKAVTRLRVSELSLKRLWGRRRILPEFAEEVADWLARAGMTLFFAGSTYGVVKTAVVEGWPRVTSKRLTADLEAVAQGSFDFSKLGHLLADADRNAGDDE
jgi:hypothetical protein